MTGPEIAAVLRGRAGELDAEAGQVQAAPGGWYAMGEVPRAAGRAALYRRDYHWLRATAAEHRALADLLEAGPPPGAIPHGHDEAPG